MELFAFPVNLILALVWGGIILWLWKDYRRSAFVRWFLSPLATLSSILLFGSGCLVAGFAGVECTCSWWFTAVLFFMMTVLAFVLLRGLRDAGGKLRYRFILNHFGLLTVLVSLFFGSPDKDVLRLSLTPGMTSNIAYREDGSMDKLRYEVCLEDFRTDYYENGVPAVYEATISVNGKTVSLKVNSPYAARFAEQIYLVSASGPQAQGGCVLQVVRQPWKWLTVIGIILMVTGAVLLFVQGPQTLSGHREE